MASRAYSTRWSPHQLSYKHLPIAGLVLLPAPIYLLSTHLRRQDGREPLDVLLRSSTYGNLETSCTGHP